MQFSLKQLLNPSMQNSPKVISLLSTSMLIYIEFTIYKCCSLENGEGLDRVLALNHHNNDEDNWTSGWNCQELILITKLIYYANNIYWKQIVISLEDWLDKDFK